MLKKTVLILLVLSAMLSVSACAGKQTAAEKKTVTSAAVTEADSLSDDSIEQLSSEFMPLPEGAENCLSVLSAKLEVLFPDVPGRRMYGYKGMDIVSPDGSVEHNCYIFDFYTYKKKTDVYTKIATVAQIPDTDTVFVYDEESGKYIESTPESE